MTKVNKTVRIGAKNMRKEGKTFEQIGKTFKVALAGWWGRVSLAVHNTGRGIKFRTKSRNSESRRVCALY